MELMKKFKRYKSIRKTNFEEVSQKWLEMKKNSIKESTYYNYMFIIDKYLIPTFSQISLKKLSEMSTAIFLNNERRKTVSEEHQKQALMIYAKNFSKFFSQKTKKFFMT